MLLCRNETLRAVRLEHVQNPFAYILPMRKLATELMRIRAGYLPLQIRQVIMKQAT